MNKIYKIVAFILCLVSFFSVSCEDSAETEGGGTLVEQELIPMKFSLSGWLSTDVSPVSTRALMGEEEKRSLVGEDIGLYIMLDTDYERVLHGMPLQAEYRYMNVRGKIMPDGSIYVANKTLYYPQNQQSRVAVIAYSPYREDMPDDILYKGTVLSIQDNQSSMESLNKSDLLIGFPEKGNPFRDAFANGDSQSTLISFSHAYSRIFLTVDLASKTDAAIYESITVALDNTPLNARVNLASSLIEALPLSKARMEMLNEQLGRNLNGGTASFQAAAIVFPQEYDSENPPRFIVTLKGRPGFPDKVVIRTDTLGTAFSPGRDVRYSIHIDIDE